jgi:serine protease
MGKLSLLLGFALLLAPFAFAGDIGSYPQMEIRPPADDDGEVLIDFDNASDPAAISAMLTGLGISSGRYSWFSSEEKWLRVSDLPSGLLARIKNSSKVEDVEPNYYYSAFLVPNDPYYKYQWHLDLIGMKDAWDYPKGASVTVAVIDTGVAYEEYEGAFRAEDLSSSQFIDPYNFVEGNNHANDDHGHGTHVAGTIAQVTDNGVGVAGVAPSVRIMPLKVLTSSGYGTVSDIAAAIRYATDHGAAVINMSLGGPFYSHILHKACKYAHDRGVVIVCAAGNSGRSGISYPAAFPECISVSAVRYDGKLTWYSSYGKGLTIAAPGGDMNVDQNGDGLMDGVLQNTLNPQDTTKQGYFLFQGTSMAAPHVAAVASLLMSHGVTDPEKVREWLQASATQVDGGDPSRYGAGIVNAHRALKSLYYTRNLRVLALSFLMAFVLAHFLNRGTDHTRRTRVNMLGLVGLLFGSTGLFFLGKFLPGTSTFFLTHPVPEWQYPLFGIRNLVSPIFFSVLPAFSFAMLCYAWEKLASLSFGFAAGYAAFLLYQAFSPLTDIRWVPGSLFESVWLFANCALCCGVAAMAVFRNR